MVAFVDTIHCRSRVHCATCRNLEGGRSWRAGLATAFALPSGVVDFECPNPPAELLAESGGCGDCRMTKAERTRLAEIKAAGRPGSKPQSGESSRRPIG